MFDYLLDDETKVSILSNDLEYEKDDAFHNIVLESKLIKLEISPEGINRIKNSVL